MEHLEDLLQAASIEAPLFHGGRWYVTKDAALAGMTAARLSAIEESAKVAAEAVPGARPCRHFGGHAGS